MNDFFGFLLAAALAWLAMSALDRVGDTLYQRRIKRRLYK